jgi:hypothetical protein
MRDGLHLQPSPYEAEAGQRIGLDPGNLPRSALEGLGHPKSYPKIIRAYCLECCAGQEAEVRKCVSFDCPMWPVRMGRNPFHARAK